MQVERKLQNVEPVIRQNDYWFYADTERHQNTNEIWNEIEIELHNEENEKNVRNTLS